MPHHKLALSFRVFQNGHLVREDTLTQTVIKIGKVPSAHLQIADDAVSRMHAIVEVTGREVSLIDLGSTRGTFVNGKRIHKARLEAGDVITLGDTRIVLGIAEPGAAPERAPEPVPERARPPAIPAAVRRAAAAGAVTISGTIDTAAALPLDVAARPAMFSHAVAAVAEVADAVEDPGAARAVEIAAMLGDSVVGVKHCIDPRGGKVRPATWVVVAGGAACLLASAIAFTASVGNAADNRARWQTWTQVEHKPAHAFRPHVLPPGLDWIAFGGFGLALVGLTLGVLRIRAERISPYYRIGTAPGVELALEGAPAPSFPLVAPSGDEFVFNYGAGIDGELLLDGSSLPLSELAAAGRARPSAITAGAIEVPIPPRARIRARTGRTTFLISSVARPRRHAVPLLAGLERRALSYFAGSLALHLGIWAFLQLLPPEATSLSIDVPAFEPIAVAIKTTTTNDPVPEVHPESDGAAGTPGATAMPLPPGPAGKPDAVDRGRLRIERASTPPQLARSEEIERARTAGFLGSRAMSSAIHVLGAAVDVASGFETESFNGPLVGGYGEGPGRFGGGLSGDGFGTTCDDGRPCAIGYRGGGGVIGGDPRRRGVDYGLHSRGFGRPDPRPGVPPVGEPTLSGPGYDKSIIRRYIRHNLDKIGYCYDKQLLAHPDLGGELTVTFLIASSGEVQTSTGTGFDRDVAGCVAAVIKTISFPRPGDGLGVQVNYPFHFHAAAAR
jgi:hypothetical protein